MRRWPSCSDAMQLLVFGASALAFVACVRWVWRGPPGAPQDVTRPCPISGVTHRSRSTRPSIPTCATSRRFASLGMLQLRRPGRAGGDDSAPPSPYHRRRLLRRHVPSSVEVVGYIVIRRRHGGRETTAPMPANPRRLDDGHDQPSSPRFRSLQIRRRLLLELAHARGQEQAGRRARANRQTAAADGLSHPVQASVRVGRA